jgi:hypothetical protein
VPSAGKGSRKTGRLVAESLEAEIASEAGHTFAEDNHGWVAGAIRNVRFREQAGLRWKTAVGAKQNGSTW